MYVITPHGGEFAEAVEVRLPLPTVTLTPYQEFKIAKAQPGGPWVVLEDTVVAEATLSAKVDSFSYFMVVIVTYLLPIAQLPPLQMSSSLACTGGRCTATDWRDDGNLHRNRQWRSGAHSLPRPQLPIGTTSQRFFGQLAS